MDTITNIKSNFFTKDTALHFKELLQTFPGQEVKKGIYILQAGAMPKDIIYIEKGKVISLAKYHQDEKEVALGYFQKE